MCYARVQGRRLSALIRLRLSQCPACVPLPQTQVCDSSVPGFLGMRREASTIRGILGTFDGLVGILSWACNPSVNLPVHPRGCPFWHSDCSLTGADPDWWRTKGPMNEMNERIPMKRYWSKADAVRDAGPDFRPRPAPADFRPWEFSTTCNIVLPAPDTDVLYLDGGVYEILAPGTTLTRCGSENRVWRGLHTARAIDPGSAGS